MKLGVDLSITDELENIHPKYYYKNKEIEPFDFFSKHSKIDIVRLRLWNSPYDKEGYPYGGGTSDLVAFIKLARRAQDAGMKVMLDFHYSDFWVDPSRQKLPKAWTKYKNFEEFKKEFYEFTRDTLKVVKAGGIDLVAIQIGNEISHGMCWPYGNIENEFDPINGGGFDGLAELLKLGVKASKLMFPKAKTVIHLEHSGSYDMQDWFFSNLVSRGVDFDIIGESYYPYWHGPFSMFKDCVSRLMEKYKKEVWVVELGYEFVSTGDKDVSEVTDAKEGDFIVGNVNGRIPFPQTKQGQADYLALMLKICKEIGVGCVCYWEPTWIDVKGEKSLGWASDAGQRYCGLTPVESPNTWNIETFFDEDGNANPCVDIFCKDYVDSIE